MRRQRPKQRKKPREKGKEHRQTYFDYSLLFIIIFLVGFGLVMIYSTSSYEARTKFNDDAYYLKKQLVAIVLGFVAMALAAGLDYRIWKRFAMLIYVLAFGLCVSVFFIGREYNGQARWLSFGGVSFQPSEFAKLAVIILLAAVVSKTPKKMKEMKSAIKVLIMVAPIIGVVAVGNLSTAIIIAGIALVLIFVSSPKYLQFILLGVGSMALGIIFIFTASYRQERIMVWLHPEESAKGYQTLQALYAIGSGGLFGKGLGESIQKLGFVPEAQNDMIFSIICEELGLFGAICVISMFLLLIWRFMIIASNARDLFGAMVVTGIMAHIAIQVILNVAVVTNTIPNTGITLPFISYGGTSIVFLMMEMGIALSISRGIRLEAEDR